MSDPRPKSGTTAQPKPLPREIDLSGIDTAHPEGETVEHLLRTVVAETASGVTGVHTLGGAAARVLDRAARAVARDGFVPGVVVTRRPDSFAVAITMTVEYPHPVTAVLADVRRQVMRAAAGVTDATVVLNLTVADVHGPFDPIDEPADS